MEIWILRRSLIGKLLILLALFGARNLHLAIAQLPVGAIVVPDDLVALKTIVSYQTI
jgi:hypothetical protein